MAVATWGVMSRMSARKSAGTVSKDSAATAAAAPVHAPGFDGLRALAVLAVIAFHEQFAAVPGGFIGVDIFFVLSGYLITDLLAAHWGRRGRLDLRGFWIRRARRLLPALAAVLVVVTAAAAVIEPDQLGQLRAALVAAATYSSNWWQAFQHQSYFMVFGPPPPLRHLWSLAIEEQFYLLWPLILAVVLAVGRTKRIRASVAWLGAAGSALAMAAIYVPGADPSRVYYGTDTHATALLIGAALALTWPLAELRAASAQKRQRLDLAGVIGIAVLAWAAGHFGNADPTLYPAGLVIVAIAAGALVMSAATSGTVGSMLAWPPLRWLGVRSYGIYLWHWPVIAFTFAVAGPGSQSVWMWIIETTAAVALAAASWRWIETPILRDGVRATVMSRYRTVKASLAAARRSPTRAFPAVALAGALIVTCTAGYRVLIAPASTSLESQIANGVKVSEGTRIGGSAPSRESLGAQSDGATAPGLKDPDIPGRAGQAPARSSGAPATLPRQPGSAKPRALPGSAVTAIGDSVMLAAAAQLRDALHGVYIDARISRQMGDGLQTIGKLASSGRLRRVVVVGLGTNGTVTSGQIRQLVAEAGGQRRLVLVTVFVPRPWERADNAVLEGAARHYTNVVLANWQQAIANHTSLLWSDRVHPRPQGARLYARVVAGAVQATQAQHGQKGLPQPA
ncbi:MAG: acyltransferase family protein [Micromonosporaceae bacterium]